MTTCNRLQNNAAICIKLHLRNSLAHNVIQSRQPIGELRLPYVKRSLSVLTAVVRPFWIRRWRHQRAQYIILSCPQIMFTHNPLYHGHSKCLWWWSFILQQNFGLNKKNGEGGEHKFRVLNLKVDRMERILIQVIYLLAFYWSLPSKYLEKKLCLQWT